MTFYAKGADSMMVSQDIAFAGAVWEGYKTNTEYTLNGEDGSNTVYVKFKDLAENETPVFPMISSWILLPLKMVVSPLMVEQKLLNILIKR